MRQVLSLSQSSKPKPRSQSSTTTKTFELQPAPQTTTPAQRDNSPIFANHVHDFLPHHPRPVSQIHLSAWLTSVLSVWRTWMSFRTPVFTMIFEMREQWRPRPKTCQTPIPAQQPPNKLLLSSNPAIMFYTTSVCGNGRRRQIAARFVAMHSMLSRYSTKLEVRFPLLSTNQFYIIAYAANYFWHFE